jgi:hypothetical protein
MTAGRRAGALVLLVIALAACRGGDEDAEPGTTPSTAPSSEVTVEDPSASTTSVPDYAGDPDSPFCVALAGADDRPLLDPFEAGIDATEVELRLRALRVRFDELVGLAPAVIVADVRSVADGIARLDETLAVHDHDLGAAADSGADLTFLDAPEFAAVGARLAGYQSQVCDR